MSLSPLMFRKFVQECPCCYCVFLITATCLYQINHFYISTACPQFLLFSFKNMTLPRIVTFVTSILGGCVFTWQTYTPWSSLRTPEMANLQLFGYWKLTLYLESDIWVVFPRVKRDAQSVFCRNHITWNPWKYLSIVSRLDRTMRDAASNNATRNVRQDIQRLVSPFLVSLVNQLFHWNWPIALSLGRIVIVDI